MLRLMVINEQRADIMAGQLKLKLAKHIFPECELLYIILSLIHNNNLHTHVGKYNKDAAFSVVLHGESIVSIVLSAECHITVHELVLHFALHCG